MSLEEFKEIAKSKKGECLSTEYEGIKTKLLWKCNKGHIWSATAGYVKYRKKWCPQCSAVKSVRRYTIIEVQKIAKERGGECLSDSYVNLYQKMQWRCSNGHVFEKNLASVKKGTWCSSCTSYIGEEICRQYFEQIFQKPFPKERPEWLLSQKGNRLELDGYNSELKIAFEHQGLFHYKYIPYFHKSKEIFKEKQLRDKYKREKCKEFKIFLIEIPELNLLTKVENLKEFIKEECIKKNIPLPTNYDKIKVNIDMKSLYSREELKEMQLFAKEKGGECLSDSYLGRFGQLKWRCQCGYVWKASPANVINHNSWCPKCANTLQFTLKDVKRELEIKGGKCLSEKYINNSTKMKFECGKGHIFETTFANIRSGSWCITCGGTEKLTIEEMHQLAKENGGECLSEEYINNLNKIKWKCKNGHIFKSSPSTVKMGSWCWECGRESLRMGIERMNEEARKRNGECLSSTYKNNRTKLEWTCEKGHIWHMEPRYILNFKKWCPVCNPSRNRTIKNMHELAEKNNGECLSDRYKNTTTPLKWKCKNGHIFMKKPQSVESGQWCSECRNNK